MRIYRAQGGSAYLAARYKLKCDGKNLFPKFHSIGFFKHVTTTKSMKKKLIITSKTKSEETEMENIESLASNVSQMEGLFTWWNNCSNWLVLAVIIAGILLYIAQYMTTKKAIQLDKAKDALTEAMDRKQTLKIATLNAEVAKANEKAESERLERMTLEAELSPRKIEQRQSSIELEQFQGMSVVIESLAESEPWRTAGQIAYVLDKAKWSVLPGMKRFLDATMFFDGVTVETNVGARPREDRSQDAGDALVAVLTKNKIQAHRMPSRDNLPINTIKVRVGLKPAEYFDRNRKDLEYGNMLYR
jgi:hypothetical protein